MESRCTVTDFLFITDDEMLTDRLADSALATGWNAQTVAGFFDPGKFPAAQGSSPLETGDDALAVFESRLFKAVFVDIRAGKSPSNAGRGLRLLEWMVGRRPFTRYGVFTDTAHAPQATLAVMSGAEDFIFTDGLDRDKLRLSLAGILDRYPDWRAGLIYEKPRPDGVVLSWAGVSAAARVALDMALREACQPGIVAISGASGSGRKNLARIMSAVARAQHTAVFSPSGKTDDEQMATWRLCLAECSALERSAIIVTEPVQTAKEWQDHVVGMVTKGEMARAGQWLKLILVMPAEWRSSSLSNPLIPPLTALLRRHEITLVPLRERRDDIALLADCFLASSASDPSAVPCLARDALTALSSYSWPGQVTELREAIKGAVSRASGGVITARDLPVSLIKSGFYVAGTATEVSLADLSYDDAKKLALNNFNQEYIFTLIGRAAGNLTVAAELAGMDRSNFKKIVKKYFPEGVRDNLRFP